MQAVRRVPLGHEHADDHGGVADLLVDGDDLLATSSARVRVGETKMTSRLSTPGSLASSRIACPELLRRRGGDHVDRVVPPHGGWRSVVQSPGRRGRQLRQAKTVGPAGAGGQDARPRPFAGTATRSLRGTGCLDTTAATLNSSSSVSTRMTTTWRNRPSTATSPMLRRDGHDGLGPGDAATVEKDACTTEPS